MNAQDRELIETKFEGLTKLMNAHFINVADKQEAMIKNQVITNGRVSGLEEREMDRVLYCERIQTAKTEREKYRKWRMILMIIASAVIASLITNFGILEFLKLVK